MHVQCTRPIDPHIHTIHTHHTSHSIHTCTPHALTPSQQLLVLLRVDLVVLLDELVGAGVPPRHLALERRLLREQSVLVRPERSVGLPQRQLFALEGRAACLQAADLGRQSVALLAKQLVAVAEQVELLHLREGGGAGGGARVHAVRAIHTVCDNLRISILIYTRPYFKRGKCDWLQNYILYLNYMYIAALSGIDGHIIMDIHVYLWGTYMYQPLSCVLASLYP